MTAAVLGLAALLLLPFATLRGSRIQTGDDLGTLASLGPAGFTFLVVVWLVLAVLAWRRSPRENLCATRIHAARRRRGFALGLVATIALLGVVGLSAVAAERLLADAPEFARVSVGGGAWGGVVAGYMALLAARREVADSALLRFALSVIAPLGVVVMLFTGALDDMSMLREYASQGDRFAAEVLRHLAYSGIALVVATVLGVALGILAFRHPRLRRPVFAAVSVFQTIPGLAMVGLLFGPLSWLGATSPTLKALGVGGLGWAPVVVALTLYALLAIVRNTYAGLDGVPAEVIDAGFGMGMTERQVMLRVRLPLALSALVSGVRTGTVQTVGNATIGAFVAAGTLGLFVFGGLSQQATDLIMLGSVAIVALALLADALLRALHRLIVGTAHSRMRGAHDPL